MPPADLIYTVVIFWSQSTMKYSYFFDLKKKLKKVVEKITDKFYNQ